MFSDHHRVPNPLSVSSLPPSRFSTDEGQCWHTYNFTSEPFHFSSMDSEPGSRSMNVSLWGYRNDFTKWVVITVDFHKLFTKDCAYFKGGGGAEVLAVGLLPLDVCECARVFTCRHRSGLRTVAGSFRRIHWIQRRVCAGLQRDLLTPEERLLLLQRERLRCHEETVSLSVHTG